MEKEEKPASFAGVLQDIGRLGITTPLAITGTAEELDRDLPQQLVEFNI